MSTRSHSVEQSEPHVLVRAVLRHRLLILLLLVAVAAAAAATGGRGRGSHGGPAHAGHGGEELLALLDQLGDRLACKDFECIINSPPPDFWRSQIISNAP